MTGRQLAARALNASGVAALLEWWLGRRHPDRAAILVYHRVGALGLAGALYADVVGPSRELLAAHVEFLARHCRLIALREYLDRREQGKLLPPRCVVLTVDDGYADCFTTIYPILRRSGAPATVFLPTGYLDSPSLFWWDRLAYMVCRCPVSELVLEQPRPGRFDLDGPGSRQAVAIALVNEAKRLPHQMLEAFLDHVAERTGVHPDEALARRDYVLSWAQVRAMAADGIEFGSHTVTHSILSRVDADRARWEVRHSRRRIEEELGRPVDSFCYPSGESWTFGPEHRDLLRTEGFRCAVTTIDGFNRRGTDPFALRRLSVGSSEDLPALRAALTGALRGLARVKNALLGIRGNEG